ncbi:alpha/beta hydrolase [Virgisporangium ochraceum]|uniref:Alpha/beta hydrolase n=1 Tax=Virgisporangium ochraceum TaxID=65505 RepID=A0A8J4E9E9_9ACTN|nr:alpha/beta hydrolase [Virgisporangium ochraceum]
MAYVTVDGVRLHVQRLAGDGPPLVFVHGMTGSMADFHFTLAGPVHGLGFDVVTYDLRGHGRSDRPASGYTLDAAVDDLHGVVTGLGIAGPVHLVGNSFGGTVAFRYAHRHPGSVASLVVIESEPPTAAWCTRIARVLHDVTRDDGDDTDRHPELTRKLVASGRILTGTTTIGADVVRPEGLMTADEIRAVDAPVLLVVGGRSDLHGELAHLVPLLRRCTVEVVADQGHLVLVTAPDRVRAAVLPWLADRAAVAVP